MAKRSVQWNGARISPMIGAVGGLVFVVVNAWSLGDTWQPIAIAVGVLWFLWAVWAIVRVPDDDRAYRPDARQMQAFWIVVGLEVVFIIGGAQLFIRVLDVPAASLPWVATVLGIHWLVFRLVFQQDIFLWLGWFTLSLGVVGLMVVFTGVAGADVRTATAICSGLIVGAVMLGAVLIDASRRRQALLVRQASRRPPGRST